MPLLDPALEKALAEDKVFLEQTALPIITVSASFKEDIKGFHGLPEHEWLPDVVFSRAHFSMATAIAITEWGEKMNPKKAWIVDPTNYVSQKDWNSIKITEVVGKTLARNSLLKKLKDLVDQFGRSKLPILKSITPPLLHLTRKIDKPILSMHIAAGNILAEHGKKIVQVITDPHVRDEYLLHADSALTKYCVFDKKTKLDFLEKAQFLNKHIDDPEKKIIVTGPPVDPRILKRRKFKKPWRSGPLKICITTGGLGTNKYEIRQIVKQLLPQLKKDPSPIQLAVYASTHQDIYQMIIELAKQEKVAVNLINNEKQPPIDEQKINIIYHPQIVDANELLISRIFPWADGIITKPSGDMAYDSAAAGCFILTLREWGVWEENIGEVFEQKGIAREAQTKQILDQIKILMSAKGKAQSWIEQAMNNALTIDDLFLNGSKEIIKVVKNF